jgi:hypothetical protein
MVKLMFAILTSPIVGALAGFAFPKEVCGSTSGGELGGIAYGSSEQCFNTFNAEIGAILAIGGWLLAGLWYFLTNGTEESSQL